jgi:hypothetical protein
LASAGCARSASEQAGHVHDGDACHEAADGVARGETAWRSAGDEASDLNDDFECRSGGSAEEDDCEQVVRGVAAEPCAEDGCQSTEGSKTTDHPGPDDLRRPVNHMLKHGWKLLHVGQQTLEVHETVAVLGEPARSTE